MVSGHDAAVAASETRSSTDAVPPAVPEANLPNLAAESPVSPASEPQESVAEATSDDTTTVESPGAVTIPVQSEVVMDEIAAAPEAVVIPEATSTDEVPETTAVPAAITETALAAEPTSVTNEDEDKSPVWQTVQQPAAERTIVQTEIPAPLTFGQPLPRVSN